MISTLPYTAARWEISSMARPPNIPGRIIPEAAVFVHRLRAFVGEGISRSCQNTPLPGDGGEINHTLLTKI
jgi:hypothetical protein